MIALCSLIGCGGQAFDISGGQPDGAVEVGGAGGDAGHGSNAGSGGTVAHSGGGGSVSVSGSGGVDQGSGGAYVDTGGAYVGGGGTSTGTAGNLGITVCPPVAPCRGACTVGHANQSTLVSGCSIMQCCAPIPGFDAGVPEHVDARPVCPGFVGCTGTCLPGHANVTEVVDGCQVTRCCAPIDAGAPVDAALSVRDARVDGSGIDVDSGPTWGGCGTCAAGEVCVEDDRYGGARFVADDAGTCPAGYSAAASGDECTILPTFHCAVVPPYCEAPPPEVDAGGICGCAPSLCSGAGVCGNLSATRVRCILIVP